MPTPMRVPVKELPTIDEEILAWELEVYEKSVIGGEPHRY